MKIIFSTLLILTCLSSWAGSGAYAILKNLNDWIPRKFKVERYLTDVPASIVAEAGRGLIFQTTTKNGSILTFSRVFNTSNRDSALKIQIFKKAKAGLAPTNAHLPFRRVLFGLLDESGIDAKDVSMMKYSKGSVLASDGLIQDEYVLSTECLDQLDISFFEDLISAVR